MGKLIIKENGRQTDWVLAYEDANGYYAIDCYQHTVRLDTWAEAKNYANTNGGQTMGNGDYFYDTFEEAMDDYNECNPNEPITLEDAQRIYAGLVAKDVNGEIEYIEDEEEDNE